MLNVYADMMSNPAANDEMAEFFRDKIRATVNDPETARALCPTDYPIGAKRMCLDTDYYATYNLPHVRLVDLRNASAEARSPSAGIDTVDESFEFDAIVFATGFDAMTGAIAAVDISGRDGAALKDKWANGPSTYLGLTTGGFPNLFLITGPGSPSVLSNMAVSIEQHVDWVAECLAGSALARASTSSNRPRSPRPAGCSTSTTAPPSPCSRLPNSWYIGANMPGKPRVFMPYTAGVDFYRRRVRRGGRAGLPGVQAVRPRRAPTVRTASCADCNPMSRWCSSRWPR